MLIASLVHSGLLLFLAGCVSLIKPLTWLGVSSRGCAVLVLSSGLLVVLVGLVLPATEKRSASSATQLDRFIPIYQFHEFHLLKINGNADQVYRAIKEVAASEIPFFHTLTWIRRCGRTLPVIYPGSALIRVHVVVGKQATRGKSALEDDALLAGHLTAAVPTWLVVVSLNNEILRPKDSDFRSWNSGIFSCRSRAKSMSHPAWNTQTVWPGFKL
jgi:hypothetical protein